MIAPWASVILYGSVARGEEGPNSDIDILILIPDEFEVSYNKVKCSLEDALYMIELENNVLVSPLILLQKTWNKVRTPFTLNVESDGIAL